MIQALIRNFCIIAHIDHGKSTLADRLLEMTYTVDKRQMHEQVLDSNPIERERGITIKLAPVRMIYNPENLFFERLNERKESRSFIKESSHGVYPDVYKDSDNNSYILNLIDTPGHVDFNYEVSRSLAACEGAILVVDATQGVQAQTLANLNLARRQNLVIIPVINKIDLPNALIERSIEQIRSLGFIQTDIISISAKSGKNVDQVLKSVVERIPPPSGEPEKPLRALIFSSQYDPHKGVLVYVRVVDGMISSKFKVPIPRMVSLGLKSSKIKFMASGVEIEPIEIGYFTPQMKPTEKLETGEVGYIATGLKEAVLAKVGDTITVIRDMRNVIRKEKNALPLTSHVSPLVGYKEPKPMVFLGLFPIQSDEIGQVRDALGKLRLSDSAFTYRPISSLALGNGFHCGFLGLLHAEIVQERLSREFNLSLLATAPTVEYRVKLKNNKIVIPDSDRESSQKDPRFRGDDKDRHDESLLTIQSADEFPDPVTIEQSFEPIMEVSIFSPKRYVGVIMQLSQGKRAEFIDMQYMVPSSFTSLNRTGSFASAQDDQVTKDVTLVKFTYLIPLSEMIVDFFDQLKSVTEGYASLDYEFFDYQPVELVKLEILLNHEKVDAFAQLVVAERAVYLGRLMVDRLKDVIPRQQFTIPIQAAISGQIIAREDVKAFRKDVTQKLYGGDRTRKDKLLEAQKKGKARMKLVGRVEIPQEAFLKVFKSG